MPCDGFAFAVGVCGQEKLVNVFELGFQIRDFFLFVRADHVQRSKPVVNVHAKACPCFLLVFCWDVGSTTGQVTNVTHRRLNNVIRPQVGCDFFGFCR